MSKLCIYHYNAPNIISIVYLAHQASSMRKLNLHAAYITYKNIRIINNSQFNLMSKRIWHIIVHMQIRCLQMHEKYIIIGKTCT